VPSFVLGVINAVGRSCRWFDLKKFFDLPQKGLGQLNKVVILRNEQMEFGILADDILGARPIALETMQVSPPTVTGIGASYVRGVTAERVIILDAERILGDEKIIVNQGQTREELARGEQAVKRFNELSTRFKLIIGLGVLWLMLAVVIIIAYVGIHPHRTIGERSARQSLRRRRQSAAAHVPPELYPGAGPGDDGGHRQDRAASHRKDDHCR